MILIHNQRTRPVNRIGAAFLAAVILCFASPAPGSDFSGPFVSSLEDSLVLRGEVYILTAEELAGYCVNDLEDLLAHLPGVTWWREGPPGSRTAFSVDGRPWRGPTLLVNGIPWTDPYTGDPLAGFLNLSRVRRVEVVYSSSPSLTGRVSTGSVINIVLEEGGREPPVTAGDFTWGASARKSRKIWFSSPDGPVSGTLAYDEYMHEAFESLAGEPASLIGDYHSRSALVDLAVRPGEAGRLFLRMRRFEDSYTGTPEYPIRRATANFPEEVRKSGFDAETRYLHGGLEVSLRQRFVETDIRAGLSSSHLYGVAASRAGKAGPVRLRLFASAERVTFESVVSGERASGELDRFEGGVTSGGRLGRSGLWRAGLFGGATGETGGYLAGEAGFSRGSAEGFHQSMTVARRVRAPSCSELYMPLPGSEPRLGGTAPEGDTALDIEVFDEVVLGAGLGRDIEASLFARRERDRIGPALDGEPRYVRAGGDDVIGMRGRAAGRGGPVVLGFGYRWEMEGTWFADRAGLTGGIPDYSIGAGLSLSRLSFKKTELLVLRLDAVEAGKVRWNGAVLDRRLVLDLSASITVMGAVVKFQWKNLTGEEYQTVPGLLMPGRHYRFGINWRLFD